MRLLIQTDRRRRVADIRPLAGEQIWDVASSTVSKPFITRYSSEQFWRCCGVAMRSRSFWWL